MLGIEYVKIEMVPNRQQIISIDKSFLSTNHLDSFSKIMADCRVINFTVINL